MASKRICAQCLSTLRQTLRSQRAESRSTLNYSPRDLRIRALSTQSSLFQQQQQKSQEVDSRPPVLPITNPTSVSIPTAAAPKQPSLNDASKFPSSSEMQKAIGSRLASSDLTTSLAKTLRRTATKTTETYITYGLTETLFNSCSVQADYSIPEDQRSGILSGKGPDKTAGGEDLGRPAPGRENAWWFTELGLQPTFSTWSQVSYIHMYLLTVRLRAMDSPTTFQNYQRYLLEHFSHAAEDKMIIMHNMAARGVRNRYLKDLFLQWRGILAAYDEGMVNGDVALAGAVWRNVWKCDEDVDWTKVAAVVSWMRCVVNELGYVDIQDLAGNLEGKDGLFERSRDKALTVAAEKNAGLDEELV